MRVAILTDNDFAKVNGVTTTLKAVLHHAPADLEPHVYTFAGEAADLPGYTAFAARGMPIPFYGEMRMYAPPVTALTTRLRDGQTAAIHLTTPGPSGLAARRLADRLGVPLIGSYHTELGEYTARLSGSRQLGAWMQAYMRWLYGACERVLVPSEATRAGLVERGWRADRLLVWPRGVDEAAFSPARRSAALRRSWQVSDDRPALLYAGRLSHEKGLGLLCGLSELLDAHRITHRLVLAGDGPMAGDLRRRLPDAVFTGTVGHGAMGEIMASADLFLFPSETDTAGNVVLEAQACGVPVLVTDRGGPHENIRDGETGFVCGAGSERDFCWRVAQLLADPEKRRAMGCSARAFASARTWPEALRPLFALYRESLQRAEARSGSHGRLSHRATAHV